MTSSLPFSVLLLILSAAFFGELQAARYLDYLGEWKELRDINGNPHPYNGIDIRNGVDLEGVNLVNADLQFAQLWDTNLSMADLSGANLTDALFNAGSLLAGAQLVGTNLTNVFLKNTELTGIRSGQIVGNPILPIDWKLVDGYLLGPGADLRNASLGSYNLGGINLADSDFSYANLFQANLRYADLTGARLTGANLVQADLSNARLVVADLSQADLSNSYLSDTNLSGAELYRTTLTGAYMRFTNLEGVRSSHIVGEPLMLRAGWSLNSGYLVGEGIARWLDWFLVPADGLIYVDTGDWLGWLEISGNPWFWNLSVSEWMYIQHESAESQTGWVYVQGISSLQVYMEPNTDVGWSFAFRRWLYVPSESLSAGSGWVFLL